MKQLICPFCSHSVKRSIGIYLKCSSIYYLNAQKLGWFCPSNWFSEIWKYKKPLFLGFHCRYCSKPFPEKMWKEIRKYLKQDAIIEKLKES